MVQSISAALFLVGALLASGEVFAAEARDGARAFSAKDYAKAEEAFQGAVQQDPTDFDQWYNLGVSQYKQGKLNEAKESFTRATQHPKPDGKLRALYNLGNTEAMLQQFEAAKKAYQQALSYDLNNKAVRENLAWVEEQLKNPPQQQEQQQQQQSQQDDQQKEPQNDQRNKEQQSQSQQNQSQQNDAQKQPSREQQEQKSSTGGDKQKQESQEQSGGDPQQRKAQGGDESMQDGVKQMERDDAERVLRQVEDQLGKNRVQDSGEGEARGQKNDW